MVLGSGVVVTGLTFRMPLTMPRHIVNGDVANRTKRRSVFFLEENRRIAARRPKHASKRALRARELRDVLDSPSVYRPALYQRVHSLKLVVVVSSDGYALDLLQLDSDTPGIYSAD